MAQLKTVVWLLVAFPVFGASQIEPHPKIHPAVLSKLSLTGKADIFINIKGGIGEVLKNVTETDFGTRDELLRALGSNLKSNAAKLQEAVLKVLQATTGIQFESFWLTNQIYVPQASSLLVSTLTLLPTVSGVEEVKTYELHEPVGPPVISSTRQSTGNAWGIDKIQAPTAWSYNSGNNGLNIRVANIDTGVKGTHEALVGNYLGTYGWYDPYAKSSSPNDNQGHGTHTMGTIAGSKGIGVAPGAKWMACKGCSTNGCAGNALLACAQYVTCPTLPNGGSADCSKAPHVVSNSWGGGQGETWYDNSIAAWKAAKIIPIFSNGNSGPNCGTANSPGDRSVIAVGATDSTDKIADFSSKGPSVNGVIKPELSAPGSNVRSAYYTGNTAYATMSGTSMAAPHVSGTVALMLAAKPTLSYDDVRKYLYWASDENVVKTGTSCGSTTDSSFPNNIYGWGRINAYWAVYYVKNY